MRLSGIAKNSAVDYPGKLAATLFTPGCNYDCFYCHNRELLQANAPHLSLDEVLGFLKKRIGMLDGVVISGGEPTLQQDLADFIRLLNDMGYPVKLDTNGSNPAVVEVLLAQNLLDYVALDYKAPFARYGELCGGSAGQDAQAVMRTMQLLSQHLGADNWQLRTTVAPTLKESDILTMARELPVQAHCWVFNRYRIPQGYDDARLTLPTLTKQQLEGIFEELREVAGVVRLEYVG
ncbi:anaerobic ribonucleoside-triphosphate reductase activating protein [Eubacteriales bacterium OttesenSCG-928-N14]|nr:anaerobic ribonucleoside-triphosphate reductase activating protein [Eubacteriales bacterium OttesenSCG-928-N14]